MPGENLGWERAPARQGEDAFVGRPPQQQWSQLWSSPMSFLFGIGRAQHGPGKLYVGLSHSRLVLGLTAASMILINSHK